jgi:hypothetical protein
MTAVFTTPDMSSDRIALALSGPPPTAMTFGTSCRSERGMPILRSSSPFTGRPSQSNSKAHVSATAPASSRACRSGWVEIPPDDPSFEVPESVDGALVMFIQPRTKQRADPAHLEKVSRLARILPVGVDGGITREIAAQCFQAGARYVVSGRDLLTVTHREHRKQRERDLLP